ncbi:hypothetical protein KKD81_00650 [Patescibacteria group bacterium]|nr:hypothetical protein [Patescibacteria group bacterium]MBU2220428.1 hypothetical protein [Patescibacteria group bacterium]
MEIIRQEQAEKFNDGTSFIAHEYRMLDKDINTARIEIQGRYPKTGSMRNTLVKEVVYVESGCGEVIINEDAQKVKKGDVIFYDANETVVWNGVFSLITTCTPAWSKDQHEFLP